MGNSSTQRVSAGLRAQNWLHRVPVRSPPEEKLKRLGVALCNDLTRRSGAILEPVAPPTPAVASAYALIEMPRTELLALCMRLRVSDAGGLRALASQLPDVGAVVGGLAISYARVNDIAAVASLVAVGHRAGVSADALREAETYLLDQQHDDGYFGLLAAEQAIVGVEDIRAALLRLTVDVLWAFAEAHAAGRHE